MAAQVLKHTQELGLSPEQVGEIEDYLKNVSDEICACRAWGHNWPKLKPPKGKGKKTIKGVIVTPLEEEDGAFEGVYEITLACLDGCGKERYLITAPHGEIDWPATYRYNNPDGYKAPRGLTRRMCMEESWRRSMESLTGVKPTP